MQLEDLLKKQRKIYVDFFQKEMKKSDGISEVLLDLKNKQKIELFSWKRYDCLEKSGDSFDIIEFNNDQLITHNPTEFKYKELTVLLEPFFWNECEMYFRDGLSTCDPIIQWGKKWIEMAEVSDDEEKRIYKVIHQVAPPVKIGKETMITFDFGTAEVKAVMELIAVIEKMGIKYIRLNSASALKK